jgi:hypothetical protein
MWYVAMALFDVMAPPNYGSPWLSEVVLAEIHAPAPEQEWQMLSAFLDFINRHFGDRAPAITIAPMKNGDSAVEFRL